MKSPFYKTAYRRYTWVGNRIAPEDMAALHRLRQTNRTPITRQVAEAVRRYVIEKGA